MQKRFKSGNGFRYTAIPAHLVFSTILHKKYLSGNYRIVYQIHDKALVVVIIRIGDRKEIYRDI